MAFTFSNLAQNLYFNLGQVDARGLFTATGGSATTIVNSSWGSLPDPPEEDFAKSYLALVTRDAGGLGAAPELEYSLVSAYVDSSNTLTVGTITAVASGDSIMLAAQDKFPIEAVLFAANRALQKLGDIVLTDESITTSGTDQYYAIPVALKRQPPLAVYYKRDSDAYKDIPVPNWKFFPATAGTAGSIHIPDPLDDETLVLYYKGVHPQLTAYSSVIIETIHPDIAILATQIALFEWWNSLGNGSDLDIWKESTKWPQQLSLAKAENPIWELQPTASGLLVIQD
jgi:hypothetical protein